MKLVQRLRDQHGQQQAGPSLINPLRRLTLDISVYIAFTFPLSVSQTTIYRTLNFAHPARVDDVRTHSRRQGWISSQSETS